MSHAWRLGILALEILRPALARAVQPGRVGDGTNTRPGCPQGRQSLTLLLPLFPKACPGHPFTDGLRDGD